MRGFLPIIGAALALSGCSAPAPAADAPEATDQIEAPAPTPAAIDAAKTALAAEPQIKDLHYDPTNTVQWNIGVLDDGSRRFGYAQYVCMVLKEKGALGGRTHVRIVDIAKVAQGEKFRDANLGHVICETGDIVDA
ncbi:hypothetical protein [Sphingopyxis granuli]|uniref:hypothetical protein n=1 Tax=Sphingopyxis granuli TaxID=267128 RepID=UPI001BAEFE8A|nr:hypothetical protein [Sphingopyxis granuli]QUM72224.1 hypothetical protein ICN83_18335 [Sphingopyxis granuli]